MHDFRDLGVAPSSTPFGEDKCGPSSLKLKGYFSLPSVHHYLIVDPEGPPVIHHGRQADGPTLTSLVQGGMLSLSPPGIGLDVAEMFAAA